MKIKKITRKKFERMKLLEIDKEILNTEAILYHYRYEKNAKRVDGVFKCFYRLNDGIFANKLFTVQMLCNNSRLFPSNFIIPDGVVSMDDYPIGCYEEYVKGINLESFLNNPKNDIMDKINYLKQIGNLLEHIRYLRREPGLERFYINDLHAGNFIIKEDKELALVDLDSCKIGFNRPFPSKYLSEKGLLNISNKYKKFNDANSEFGLFDADENSDLYCYCITILNYLYKGNINDLSIDEYYKYLLYLLSLGIDEQLITCFDKILLNCDNVNPKDYLSSLTYEQVSRANKDVYKKAFK